MTPAARHGQPTTRLDGLDGLRALAAGAVLVYHVWRFGDPGGGLADAGPLTPVMPHLWHGVTLFFVLSGFLLYRPFAAAARRGNQAPSIARYLRSRALRIVPAYWVVLLATAFLLRSAMVADDAGPRTPGVPDPELLAVNLLLLQNISPSTIFTGVGPAWSLAVEVCFYLLLPLLALAFLVRRRPGRRSLATVLAPAAALLAIGLAGKLAVLAPGGWDLGLVRSILVLGDLFALGMVVAVVATEIEDGRIAPPRRWRPLAAAAIGAVVVLGLVSGATHMAPVSAGTLGFTTLAGVACALLVALVALPARVDGGRRPLGLLESRGVVAAGLVSYSAFLWHEPLLRWLHANGLTFAGTSGFVLNVATTAALTAVLAVATYRLVETPARKLGLGLPALPARFSLGGTTTRMSALVVCVCLATLFVAGCGGGPGPGGGGDVVEAAPPGGALPAAAQGDEDAAEEDAKGARDRARAASDDQSAAASAREQRRAPTALRRAAPKPRFTRIPRVTTATAYGPLGAEGLGRWRSDVPGVQDVRVRSSVDGSAQPALWLPSRRSGPRPLLVVLHSWSNGYTQHLGIPYARWTRSKGWAMIAPHFRGVNDKTTAAGSNLAVGDVADAIAYARRHGDIDRRRVFVIGFSGGGMMSLLVAGRHPELIAGAVAWVPVHDMRLWHAYNASFTPPRDYARHIRIASGGDPSASRTARREAARRSPSSYLNRAKRAGVPVYIGHGLQDTLVLPTHAARAFNQLADRRDRIGERSMRQLAANRLPDHLTDREAATYFDGGDPRVRFSRRSGAATFVLFDGRHDMVFNPGLEWMTLVGSRRGGSPD